jgi:hypothetical protein
VRSYRPHLEGRDPFEATTGRTAFIDDLLADVFQGFPQLQTPGYLCTASAIISLSSYHLLPDVSDVTLGLSGLWLGTRTGASGTTTLA